MAAGVALVVAAATACSSGGSTTGAPPGPSAAPPSSAETADETTLHTVAQVAVPEIVVYDAPDGVETHRIADRTDYGAPRVFLVKEEAGDWVEVYLPIRPNGSTGWVRAADLQTSQHDFTLVVTLGDFNLTAYQGDEVILDATIGVARDNTPTPGGLYYTTELLQPPDPNSIYGTFAYGLSGFSEVLESFSGGPGQLGIHGTNDPSTIGTQVSAGCIRLNNDDIEALAAVLPLGTPVVVFP